MKEIININQRSFLSSIMADHFDDIQDVDVFIAADGMQRGVFRNLLRLYYNHFYDELYQEITKLIRANTHKISTTKSQYPKDYIEKR